VLTAGSGVAMRGSQRHIIIIDVYIPMYVPLYSVLTVIFVQTP